MTLYTDPTTGQVFTQSGEGREEMGDFVSAKEVYLQNQEQDSIIAKKESKDKSVSLYSNSSKIKFNGLTYLGFTHADFKDETISNTNKFEMRRAYVQFKAYLLEDPKSYFRVTLDMEHVTSDATAGDYNVRFKYAYLYLNEILPYTGVELGMAHRPWIDYEEHNSWFYRDTHWVFTEADNSAKLSNSADLGVNFKTETKYFASEVGLFTGEGYHNVEDGAGISFEWRATAHILGASGKDNQTKTTYWDASFFGQYNKNNHKYTQATVADPLVKLNQDLIWGGLHTVFNMPSFMIAAQYIKSENTMDTPDIYSKAGEGYNAHAVVRFGDEKQYRVIGRYDAWTPEEKYGVASETLTKHTYYGGLVWEQNKNVEWVANVLMYDNDVSADGKKASGAQDNSTNYMLTAQVSF